MTIVARERRPVFDDCLAREAVAVLREHGSKRGAAVFGFCIMPEHVHLVVQPGPGCDLVRFVGEYKNLVQRAWWAQGHSGLLWQRGFYDHFLRGEESLEGVVAYVLNNPVRRGLASDWREYAWCGSLALDLG
ncbi:MAG: transposase [Candidatus Riflebacteria bacterium]|nr:transposase [Candidatus Riflebacteria bacterium]